MGEGSKGRAWGRRGASEVDARARNPSGLGDGEASVINNGNGLTTTRSQAYQAINTNYRFV